MSQEAEVREADVIVVGGGGSGLAAAAEAARLGRSVIVLEKNPQTGGTTSWSVGSVTATNTPHQKRAGIQDSPQAHYEDLELHAGPLAPRLCAVLSTAGRMRVHSSAVRTLSCACCSPWPC